MKDRERASSSPRTSALGAPLDRDMLPEFLVSQGQASSEEIAAAIQEQKETGRFLGEILADHGILSKNSLVLCCKPDGAATQRSCPPHTGRIKDRPISMVCYNPCL